MLSLGKALAAGSARKLWVRGFGVLVISFLLSLNIHAQNSADCSTITASGGGTLTTSAGTRSFGTTNDGDGDYDILLNGSASNGGFISPFGAPEKHLRRVHDLSFSNCFLSLDGYLGGGFTPAVGEQFRDLLMKYQLTNKRRSPSSAGVAAGV